MTRLELANKGLPFCEPLSVALKTETYIGWLYDTEQIIDAVTRWKAGTLAEGIYKSSTKEGKEYEIKAPSRIGVVPHRNNAVRMFALDLDNHEGGTDTTVFRDALVRFFGAEPVIFTSKSGRGFRLIYLLKDAVPVLDFLNTIRSWGFNRAGRIELFPKTDKLTQFWLPNEPNENGGDTFISGEWAGAAAAMPEALPCQLTNAALDFLMGLVGGGAEGHNAIFSVSCELGEKRVPRETAQALVNRGAALNGKTDDKEVFKAFRDGYDKGAGKVPARIETPAAPTDFQVIRSELWEISQEKRLTGTEKNRASAVAVLAWLHKRGRFYHTEDQNFSGVMYFDAQRKLLLPIQGDAFLSWLADALAINRSERPFLFVKSACETEGLSERATGFAPSVYWAARGNVIYLSNGPGSMVRISAVGAGLVDNGTDGVLFPVGATLDPWKLTEPKDPFEACTLFGNMSTVAEHGRDLFQLWAMLLPTDQRTKPPLCLTGGVGSGKTRLIRGVFELFGIPARIGAVAKNGEMDFWAALDGGGVTCFDNADSRIDWFPDALAAASTAGTLEKRRLYTDAGRVSLKARAWLCVTSANPSFAADAGLADRLLVVRLGRRSGQTAETTLTDEILAHRDAGLSWIVKKLALALADRAPVPEGLNSRHPDFAEMAVRAGRAIGRGDQAVAALRAAERDKGLFNIENDNVGAVLLQILQAAPFNGSASDLLGKLIEADPALNGHVSAKRLGKRISKLWPHLETVFGATEYLDPHTKNRCYHFGQVAGFAGFKSVFLEKSLTRESNRKSYVWPSETPQIPQKPENNPDLAGFFE